MKRTKNKTATKTNKVKPFYVCRELIDVLGVKTNAGVKNRMRILRVPRTMIGNLCSYYISDIREHCPALLQSILEANTYNKMINDSGSISIDEQIEKLERGESADKVHCEGCTCDL